MKKFNVILLFVFFLIFQSCVNKDIEKFLITETELYVGFGNENYDTVIINAQGGPTTELLIADYFDIFKKVISENKNTYTVNVHQYQTKNVDKIIDKEITFEQAKEFDKETIEMFHKAVLEFKEKNKSIIIVGISFGAFVVQSYIEKYGLEDIDGVAIFVGRLNFEEEFWKTFSEGQFAIYKNGVTIEKATDEESGMPTENEIELKNIPKIAAGLGYKNYMETLKDRDLSKIIYSYGEKDEQVGRLRDDEVQFLENKGVLVIKTQGGHEDTIQESFGKVMKKLLEKN